MINIVRRSLRNLTRRQTRTRREVTRSVIPRRLISTRISGSCTTMYSLTSTRWAPVSVASFLLRIWRERVSRPWDSWATGWRISSMPNSLRKIRNPREVTIRRRWWVSLPIWTWGMIIVTSWMLLSVRTVPASSGVIPVSLLSGR